MVIKTACASGQTHLSKPTHSIRKGSVHFHWWEGALPHRSRLNLGLSQNKGMCNPLGPQNGGQTKSRAQNRLLSLPLATGARAPRSQRAGGAQRLQAAGGAGGAGGAGSGGPGPPEPKDAPLPEAGGRGP